MWNKIKWELGNIRRHYKLFLLILVLAITAYKLFVWNYAITSPIIKKDAESYVDLINSRNQCQTDLDNMREQKHSLMLQNNPDL